MNTFYQWLSSRTRQEPTSNVDQKILAYSAEYFRPVEKNVFFSWKFSGAVALATVALLVVLVNKSPLQGPGNALISESPEMILNYNDIELMADASTLSDEDWARINASPNGHYVK